jgi:multidrug resistance efflux pump
MLRLSTHTIEKNVPHDKLYSLRALRSPRLGATLAKWLLAFAVVFMVILFVPWQQNIRGTGAVTALNPMNRPQTIEAVIGGRVQRWHVQEGQWVEKGDTIVTLTEVKEKYFDPELLLRLQDQIEAKTSGLESKRLKVGALRKQIEALKQGQENKLQQTRAKVEAEKVKFQNAENQYQRNKKLFEAGNIPLTKFQEVEYKYQGAQADYQSARIELDRVTAEYREKISKAESDVNHTQSEIFEGQSDLAKLRNEYANMKIRNAQYQIVAPQSGYIVKANKQGLGETLKEGEAICTIMPQTQSDLAVEMYIKAMDVPLISKGRQVRIEFDGWPALQFSGWPSVSVGTFAGRVEVIDYVNSRPGEFRILVIPDKTDEAWPNRLRMGSGVKGWVMLDDVPVWYEIWRQLNGFPPSLYEEPLNEVLKDIKNGKPSK